jgi:hypothetical protein
MTPCVGNFLSNPLNRSTAAISLPETCPPTAGYKLRKFARKHKAGLATAAAFAALLLLGTAVNAWQAVLGNPGGCLGAEPFPSVNR